MYHHDPNNYNEDRRIKLEPSDPDFWGLYGDEFQKKEAVKKLEKWWKRQKKNLPKALPTTRKLDKIFQSFDKVLQDDKDVDTMDGIAVACGGMYVSQDSVYLLLAVHYEVEPRKIRDIWYESTPSR